MSIASELSRIQQAKADLKTQIEAKGVTVDSAATIDAYASYVEDIPTGGGGENRLNALLTNTLTALTSNDMSGVTAIGESMFSGRTALVTANLKNVTNIGAGAFRGCSNLSDVTFNTGSTVTINNNAFLSCSSLKGVTLSSASLGQFVFQDCSALTSCTISHINGSISDAVFKGCRSLIEFTTDCTDLSGTQTFQNCQSLTSVTFTNPDFYRIGKGSYHNGTFNGCSSLQYVDLTKCYQVPTLSSSNNFDSVPAAMEIRVPQTLYGSWTAATNWSNSSIVNHITAYPDYWSVVSNTYETNNGSAVTPGKAFNVPSAWTATLLSQEYDASTGGTVSFYGPMTVPEDAFKNNSTLTSFNIGSGCVEIGQSAFYMSSLSAVTIPNTVKTIKGNAFYKCPLVNVTIPDSVTAFTGSRAFYNDEYLTGVTIGTGMTNLYSDTFAYCTALTSITIAATTPPSGATYSFTDVPATGTLYVPAASISDYQSWIVGTGLSGWTVTAMS